MVYEWPKFPLSEIAEVFTGFPFKGDKYLPPNQGIRVVRGDNVTERFVRWGEKEKCWGEVTEELQPYLLRVGDVVIGMDGSKVGKNFAAISNEDDGVLLAQRVARVRAKEGTSQDYIRYLICNQNFTDYVQSVHTGTSIPHISKGQIERFEVSVPPLQLQKSIAAVLSALDSRVSLLRETNITLEAIAQALFKSWFVDFDPVRAKAKGLEPEGMSAETAALFPDRFVESELGTVPKGWITSNLANETSYLNRGISPKYTDKGGVLVLNQKCIRDFSVDFDKGRRHDEAKKKVDKKLLRSGDVLVNSTGVGTLGRVAQILGLVEPAIVDSHVTVVRAGEKINSFYLGELMKSMQSTIESMGEGSTGQTELSRTKLGELKILVPDRKILDLFESIILPLSRASFLNNQQSSTLSKLRDTLLPRLISGQLQIPDAEQAIEKATA